MKDKKPAKPARTKVQSATGSLSSVVELPSQVDIASAVSFFGNVTAAYNSASLTFNASKVDRMTTPGVQILLAATASARLKGGKITVIEASEAFNKIISDLGFSNQLKEWVGGDV